MKIEKYKNGYRVRKMYKGKKYEVYFPEKPTQKQALIALTDKMDNDVKTYSTLSFEKGLDDYINSKCNILSPSTIAGYKQLSKMYSDSFKAMNIYDITVEDIQKEINRYAEKHSPKSVKNFSGLISSVMALKRPEKTFKVTLPIAYPKETTIPTSENVKAIVEALKGTEYSVAIQLACLGLRRSEICALTVDDLNGNMLTINKAMVLDSDKKFVIKKTKTASSTRTIYIPDSLANEIREQGYVYRMFPNNIIRVLNRTQDSLGIPRCKLHELRHYFVSYAHSKGMSEQLVLDTVGHKNSSMTKIYRHSMEQVNEQKRIADSIF